MLINLTSRAGYNPHLLILELTYLFFHTTKQSNSSQTGFAFNTVNSTTFDTTISNTLDVTVQFSTNNVLNAIYSDIFVLNKIY